MPEAKRKYVSFSSRCTKPSHEEKQYDKSSSCWILKLHSCFVFFISRESFVIGTFEEEFLAMGEFVKLKF